MAPLAKRFPVIAPAAGLGTTGPVRRGFATFQKNCMVCHTMNLGGDATIGPDLNVPYNPTEYLRADALRRLIRDPQALRRLPHPIKAFEQPLRLTSQAAPPPRSYIYCRRAGPGDVFRQFSERAQRGPARLLVARLAVGLRELGRSVAGCAFPRAFFRPVRAATRVAVPPPPVAMPFAPLVVPLALEAATAIRL